MNIAVTGATGHVGANLVRTLVEGGHAVRALVHAGNRRGLEGVACEFVDGDLARPRRRWRAPSTAASASSTWRRASPSSPATRTSYAPSTSTARATSSPPARRRSVARLVHFSSIHALSPDAARRRPSTRRARSPRRRACRPTIAARPPPSARSRPASRAASTPSSSTRRRSSARTTTARRRWGACCSTSTTARCPRSSTAASTGSTCATSSPARSPPPIARRPARAISCRARAAPSRELAGIVEEVTGVRAPRIVSPMWLARVGAPFATACARVAGKAAALHAPLAARAAQPPARQPRQGDARARLHAAPARRDHHRRLRLVPRRRRAGMTHDRGALLPRPPRRHAGAVGGHLRRAPGHHRALRPPHARRLGPDDLLDASAGC